MTRTERSSYPRALNRDRSESKSGYGKEMRKNGAGAHNWGSYADEMDHEADLLDDEYEYGAEGNDGEGVSIAGADVADVRKNGGKDATLAEVARASPGAASDTTMNVGSDDATTSTAA